MIKRAERALFVIGASKLLSELGKLNVGIVEFRIRRSDFHTGDEQVPAFRNLRVRAVWARQGTDGTWVVKHESWSRGINERLGLLFKEMIDEQPMIKRGSLINVMRYSGGTHLCLIAHVKAERTHEEFFVTHALKRRAIVNLQRPKWKHRTSTALRALRHGARHVMHQTLHHLQHGHVVAESLIRLHGGEFRIMAAIHAFVAEVAIDFKDLAHAAHHESLQIELRRNAQKELHIKGIVRRHKRTRRRAAGNRLHHGSLYF